jgi:hypothetical protein
MSEEQAVQVGMQQKAGEFVEGGQDFYRAP